MVKGTFHIGEVIEFDQQTRDHRKAGCDRH